MHALEKKRPYYLHTYARKSGIKHNWMKILSKEAVFFGFKLAKRMQGRVSL